MSIPQDKVIRAKFYYEYFYNRKLLGIKYFTSMDSMKSYANNLLNCNHCEYAIISQVEKECA